MARTRLLKPDFFHDEDLAELPFEARLLLAGLWLIADREGRLEDRPRRIRASVFPYEPTVDAEALLQMLAASGFVSRYTVNDESYIQIVNFSKQQQPHYRETPSEIPPQTGHANSLLGVGRVSPAQRVRVLDRDGHKCLRCGATERLHIDHVRPGSLGGDSVDDNLQTLCASCNTSKGNRSSADYRPTLSQPRTDVAPTSANDGAPCPPVSVSVSVFDTDTVSVESVEADASTPVATFPCVGRETTWPLLDSQVQEWAALYPNLDVLDECRKALAWIQANQGHRKTAKGMPRFLVGWLNRSVERGGRRQAVPAPARLMEPVNDSPQCPHTPPCDVPGRWDCIRRTQREEFERQAS